MLQKSAMTNLSRDEADFRFNEARSVPGCACGLMEQADGSWTVWIVYDDAGDPVDASDLGGTERESAAAPPSEAMLGTLSSRFESNGHSGAIGYDSTGGFSYGAYQIASRTGRMSEFLNFLSALQPAMAAALNAAGGNDGALAGTPAFKNAWRALAAETAFFDAQHAYIESSHYQPFAARLKTELGLDLAQRSAALRDVAWSVAVQHGPNSKVFANALRGADAADLSDRQIIDAVYKERSNLPKYFPSSREEVRLALAQRFDDEHQRAIDAIA